MAMSRHTTGNPNDRGGENTTQYPEYVENEHTEQMWVRKDLAKDGVAAVTWIVKELGLDDDAYDPGLVKVTRLRQGASPPESHEGEWFRIVKPDEAGVDYWELRP